ncbi:hypothetical protein [Alloactinosynnema sp. L-07]|uniref:hypothetical protein n=1 Tax=Alloactinosynnema sp. L-07 TaxID=1653480 RepID=UPI0006B5130C|nr:hypothetical protein [Alloactinosynnema sp. L-07]
MTLRDIAALAGVRRPVVSMWRKRPMARGKLVPFPLPVSTEGGVERFSRDAVLDWLERSGRGNNDEARLDAPALGGLATAGLDALTTLLCLRALTEEDMADTDHDHRVSLAEQVDSEDRFLLSEVTALTVDQADLRFVDDLVEAAFSLDDALGRLEGGEIGRAAADRDLNAEAVNLIRTVVAACGAHLDPEGVPLVSAGEDAALAVSIAAEFSELVVPSDGAAARALRRRAAIHGIATTTWNPGRSVRLLSLLGRERGAVLDELDNTVLELAPGEIAVILGPAAVLCDDLRRDEERARATTLRPGGLALAARLPRGLWRDAHRMALGLWVCVGGVSIGRPRVADLGAVPRGELDLDDLTGDVVAALTADDARSYRYARPHDLTAILSGKPVVPRGVRAVRWVMPDAAPHLERIHAATVITSEPLSGFDVLATAGPGLVVLSRRSLAELKDAGRARVVRGSRIDPAHAYARGTVPVLAADAVDPMLVLDPFDAMDHYSRAQRTEAGDVVFRDTPRPAARVDLVGGSLVASPSKILRLDANAGIGPRTVAAIINNLPADAGEWQTWTLPVLDKAHAEELEAVIAAAAEYDERLRSRREAAGELMAALIEGVAAGAVSVTAQGNVRADVVGL